MPAGILRPHGRCPEYRNQQVIVARHRARRTPALRRVYLRTGMLLETSYVSEHAEYHFNSGCDRSPTVPAMSRVQHVPVIDLHRISQDARTLSDMRAEV